jgi:hypothetical protein
VLVLKHAQQLFGADAKAVELAGLDRSKLPPPGNYQVVSRPSGIAAELLVFIGVNPLYDFGYADVRDFGHRALSTTASARPRTRTIALTIHGAGLGLDEIEAFDSEVAGILDAIHDRDVPHSLERVVFVEVYARRAERLKSRLDEVLGPGAVVSVGAPVSDAVEQGSAQHLRDVGHGSDGREHAFLAMPFAPEFDDLFDLGISEAVRSAGLLCERIDQQAFTGEVMDRVKQQIETSRIVVADVTGPNPNVCLEVGYAWGRGKPTVLLRRKGSNPGFDLRGQRFLIYSKITEAKDLLSQELRQLVM